MKIKATFLLRPGNGNNKAGAFYIAIDDPAVHITIHGPNNPNASGTVTQVKDQRAIRSKVREKTRKNYDVILPTGISRGALQTAVEKIQDAYPKLKNINPSFEEDGIVFSGMPSGTTTRPRTNTSKLSDMWF